MSGTEKLRMHWSPRSPYVRLVMIAAHERGLVDTIDCTRTLVGSFFINTDIFSDNPLGKLPTLVMPDGTSLYDSRVIIGYLDSIGTTGQPLTPAANPEQLTALRRQALGIGMIDILMVRVGETRRPENAQNTKLLEASEAKFLSSVAGAALEVEALSGTPFGIGHMAIGCALTYADFRLSTCDWRAGHPALADWFSEISQRPSFVATTFEDDL